MAREGERVREGEDEERSRGSEPIPQIGAAAAGLGPPAIDRHRAARREEFLLGRGSCPPRSHGIGRGSAWGGGPAATAMAVAACRAAIGMATHRIHTAGVSDNRQLPEEANNNKGCAHLCRKAADLHSAMKDRALQPIQRPGGMEDQPPGRQVFPYKQSPAGDPPTGDPPKVIAWQTDAAGTRRGCRQRVQARLRDSGGMRQSGHKNSSIWIAE